VNLAVTVGKPIIPLLMEKMSWPPAGAMGPIFSEYLYVRLFQRPGEQTNDDRFWPAGSFQELLMQLRYHIAPDQSLITDGASIFIACQHNNAVAPYCYSNSVCPSVSPSVTFRYCIKTAWRRPLIIIISSTCVGSFCRFPSTKQRCEIPMKYA